MNTMKEISKKTLEIEALKRSLRDAESDLSALRTKRLHEIALRTCPQCGQWLRIPGIPSHLENYTGVVDCPQCRARLTTVVKSSHGDPLDSENYEISLDRAGWAFEDESPATLTDEQIQKVIDDLSGLPETGRTRIQRARLERLLSEKTIRQGR